MKKHIDAKGKINCIYHSHTRLGLNHRKRIGFVSSNCRQRPLGKLSFFLHKRGCESPHHQIYEWKSNEILGTCLTFLSNNFYTMVYDKFAFHIFFDIYSTKMDSCVGGKDVITWNDTIRSSQTNKVMRVPNIYQREYKHYH